MNIEQPASKRPGRNGVVAPPAPKGNRYAEKHGFNTLKSAVLTLGKRAIDGRSAVAEALKRWRLELVADLGGLDNLSTQQDAIIDLAVKQKFLLDSIDAWLLTRDTLVVGRKKSPTLVPVVTQRQQVADALAKYLNMLGLERRHKVKTIHDLLNGHDEVEDDGKPVNATGKPEGVQ